MVPLSSCFWIIIVYVFLSACLVVQLYATLWTVAWQAPLSMEISRQEYWSRLPFPTPGNLNPGIKPTPSASPVLVGGFFTIQPPRKPLMYS